MSVSRGFTVVIPARYASTRLRGKPLIDLVGKSMIQRVAEQALMSQATRVVVATDEPRIRDAVSIVGVDVALTSPEHQSGTDRVWEALQQVSGDEDDVVVNVQGDEPLIPPAVIDQAAELVSQDEDCGVATLYESLHEIKDVFNPNIVKVVSDSCGRALYFSRAPIPWERDRFDAEEVIGDCDAWHRHLGIYAFKRWALEKFVTTERSRLERLESLEQLRLLENGIAIAVAESCIEIPAGVDTPEDVERVRRFLLAEGQGRAFKE